MKKRITALLVSVALILSMILPVSATTTEAPSLEIIANSGEIVATSSEAQTITFEVVLNNPAPTVSDICALQFDLESNSNYLTLDAEATELSNAFADPSVSQGTGSNYHSSRYVALKFNPELEPVAIDDTNVKLLTIKATLAAGVPLGDYTISTSGLIVSDTDANPVAMNNASITISVVEKANYYWDFTNTASADGAVVSAVLNAEESLLKNDLTYYKPDGSTTQNVTLTSSGINNTANGRGWFSLEKDIILKKNEPWTIEWKGAVSGSSVLLAYNKDGSNSLGESLIYLAAGGAQGVDIRNTSNPVSDTKYTLASVIPTSVINDSNAIWYIINDGTGKVTLWTESNGNVTKYNTVTVGGEFTFNGVMGYYLTSSNAFNYYGTMQYLKILSTAKSLIEPVAKIGDKTYNTLEDAINAAQKEAYPSAPQTPTVIELLKDTESGFDIGVETGSIATYKCQNIVLNLNGHTLTLGHPPVGSSATLKTNGLRILPFSNLEITEGTINVDNDNVKIGIANYGTLSLTDVEVNVDDNVKYTINNRGDLTLNGSTKISNGKAAPFIAITNQPYNYPDNQNINAKLNVTSEQVVVGDVLVELSEVSQSQTGAVNAGTPEINISNGNFGEFMLDGTDKVPVGNITGGTFAAAVPEELCADGIIPKDNGDGTFGVKVGAYKVAMDVNGTVTKYETINEAIAAAPTDSYANGKAGGSATLATITLLSDCEGGFDVGVETGSLSTWKIQNIKIDLNGHTLTLGQPLVGSTGTVTNGIRVLAYSKLEMVNGTVSGLNSEALRGLQNYGATVLEDVVFANMSETYDSIGNFGSVTLKGNTVIPNGTKSAILNSTYLYSDDSQVPVEIIIEDATVQTGKIKVDLKEYTHSQTGTINAADPVITISAGTIESIIVSGDDKEVVGGITGGTFTAAVPEELCADGYDPKNNGDGTFGVLEIPVGDINRDGAVHVDDVIALLNHINNKEVLNNTLGCDLNGDGNINVIDVVRLLNHLNGSSPLQ